MESRLYEVPLLNGKILLVKPLSPFLRTTLFEAVKREHPEPDPNGNDATGAPYRKPLQNALDPALKERAEDNPQYVQDCSEAQKRQARAFEEKLIRSGVAVQVKGEERDDTIKQYAAELKEMRAMFPGLPEDDWIATVMCCLVTSLVDAVLIRELSTEALSQEEIATAAKSFRLALQRAKRMGNHREQRASGVLAGEGQPAASSS